MPGTQNWQRFSNSKKTSRLCVFARGKGAESRQWRGDSECLQCSWDPIFLSVSGKRLPAYWPAFA